MSRWDLRGRYDRGRVQIKIVPNLSNLLSGFRLLAAPFLLYLSWTGHSDMFLVLLAAALFSDSVDGLVARRLRVTSKFGTKLDSWADVTIYLTVPLCAYWLWPDIIEAEKFFVLLVLVSYILPILAGFVKFRRLTSYHSWAAKASAVLLSFSAFILLITKVAWPFRIAAVAQCISACEEIAITFRLSEPKINVKSLWHVIRRED